MIGTIWAFMPAIAAITLALITKQVYVSLFLGVAVGAMMYVGGNPLAAMQTVYEVMSEKVGANIPIIVFLVVLGILVILMQKSGGAKAYGELAQNKIHSKNSALVATAGLGCLIFVDDYFNCLTVGAVMRSVTDKFKVSHSKLAYIIDSTAAPICIISPISSWAAAVAGELEGDGLIVFIRTIPFNLYAILTIIMVFVICYTGIDFGKMKRNEIIAERTGNPDAGENGACSDIDETIPVNPKGKVRHLVLPVVILVACCIGGMLYTGGFPETGIINAFSSCNAGVSLAMGSTFALVIIAAYYIIDGVASFGEITASIPQGFKSMVPAILILTFAWSISGIMGAKGGYLDAKAFVENNIAYDDFAVFLFPAFFFVLACAIAFATGTSWGTFGVLVPIAVTILGGNGTLAVMTVSATLGGAVFGDHVSPISDTTILASAGASCNHVDHVKTQLPYAASIAAISLISYLIGGLSAPLGAILSCVIMWGSAALMFSLMLILIRSFEKKNNNI